MVESIIFSNKSSFDEYYFGLFYFLRLYSYTKYEISFQLMKHLQSSSVDQFNYFNLNLNIHIVLTRVLHNKILIKLHITKFQDKIGNLPLLLQV